MLNDALQMDNNTLARGSGGGKIGGGGAAVEDAPPIGGASSKLYFLPPPPAMSTQPSAPPGGSFPGVSQMSYGSSPPVPPPPQVWLPTQQSPPPPPSSFSAAPPTPSSAPPPSSPFPHSVSARPPPPPPFGGAATATPVRGNVSSANAAPPPPSISSTASPSPTPSPSRLPPPPPSSSSIIANGLCTGAAPGTAGSATCGAALGGGLSSFPTLLGSDNISTSSSSSNKWNATPPAPAPTIIPPPQPIEHVPSGLTYHNGGRVPQNLPIIIRPPTLEEKVSGYDRNIPSSASSSSSSSASLPSALYDPLTGSAGSIQVLQHRSFPKILPVPNPPSSSPPSPPPPSSSSSSACFVENTYAGAPSPPVSSSSSQPYISAAVQSATSLQNSSASPAFVDGNAPLRYIYQVNNNNTSNNSSTNQSSGAPPLPYSNALQYSHANSSSPPSSVYNPLGTAAPAGLQGRGGPVVISSDSLSSLTNYAVQPPSSSSSASSTFCLSSSYPPLPIPPLPTSSFSAAHNTASNNTSETYSAAQLPPASPSVVNPLSIGNTNIAGQLYASKTGGSTVHNYSIYDTAQYDNTAVQQAGAAGEVGTPANFSAGAVATAINSATNQHSYIVTTNSYNADGTSAVNSAIPQNPCSKEEGFGGEGGNDMQKSGQEKIAAEVMKVLFGGGDVSAAATAILNSMGCMGLFHEENKLAEEGGRGGEVGNKESDDMISGSGGGEDDSASLSSPPPSSFALGNSSSNAEGQTEPSETPEDSTGGGEGEKGGGGEGKAVDEDMKHLCDELAKLDESYLNPEAFPYAHNWYYLDMQQQCQGPFNTHLMIKWFQAGYFQESTHMRRNDELGFTPIDNGGRLKEAALKIIAASRAMPGFRPVVTVPYRSIAPPPPAHPMSLKTKVQNAQAALAPLFHMAKKHQRSMPTGPGVIKKKRSVSGR